MRRIISFILSIICVFSLCACGGVETPTPIPDKETDFTTENTPQIPDDTTNKEETTQPPEETEPPIVVPDDEMIADKVEPEPTKFNIQLTFVGDVMLASYKNQTTSKSFNEYSNNKPPEYFFEKVYDIFANDDFTTVNLENVFTDQNLKESAKDHDPAYWYRSKTSNVNILTSSSVEGVSLANNHTYDYGQTGYNDTVKTVSDAGLEYGTNNHTFYYEKNGYKIAVICHGLWGEWQADAIIDRIKTAEKESDYQIVFYHGGKERVHAPESWKQRASRKLIDNGADLVIGNHPHVLQPREVYNGKEIIYSLGNFCFGGNSRPENRTVIYQKNLVIDIETMTVIEETSGLIPCYVYTGDRNNYQPTPIENEEEKNKVLSFMEYGCDLPY
jgi:poly-gamma-glutamate synthesis protein (capsule biosynthesis protein)